VGLAVGQLLARLGVAWAYPPAQTCCGQFASTVGDLATARRLLHHFLKVFAGQETILCPSASCTQMVREHYPELARDAGERRAIEAVSGRVRELSEWLAARGPLPWTPHFDGSLVLHRSCKARQLGVLPAMIQVLSQVKGLKLLEVSPYYSCCGFGGVFSWQHASLSRDIGAAYLQAVQATGAQGLVSVDASCLLHLKGVAQAGCMDLQFFHLAEVLTLNLKLFNRRKEATCLSKITPGTPPSGANSSWWACPGPGWTRRPGNWCGT
jgi:L-lactate dehydrogenase complex protein LldE